LRPRELRHGVLLDAYGLGVLIEGESGIGKSECALDLIVRGHRLVADDLVEVRRLGADYSGERARTFCASTWRYAARHHQRPRTLRRGRHQRAEATGAVHPA
jgi:hypothetical protein